MDGDSVLTTPKPTSKQKKVLDNLAKGVKPPQIAKKMGISTNGVYGHIRRLKDVGLLDEDGKVVTHPTPPAEKPEATGSSNGHKADAQDQITAIVKDGVQLIEDRVKTISERTAQIEAEIEALGSEKEVLRGEAKSLEDRRKRLAAV